MPALPASARGGRRTARGRHGSGAAGGGPRAARTRAQRFDSSRGLLERPPRLSDSVRGGWAGGATTALEQRVAPALRGRRDRPRCCSGGADAPQRRLRRRRLLRVVSALLRRPPCVLASLPTARELDRGRRLRVPGGARLGTPGRSARALARLAREPEERVRRLPRRHAPPRPPRRGRLARGAATASLPVARRPCDLRRLVLR